MFGLREVVDANSDRRARMNERELVSRYGIVRVKGYWRQQIILGPSRLWGAYMRVYVRTHYRAAPGSGPLGGP